MTGAVSSAGALTSLVLRTVPGQVQVQVFESMPADRAGDMASHVALSMALDMDRLAHVLRHDPPSLAAVEQAIEQVEDIIMPARARLPLPAGPLRLHWQDAALHALARQAARQTLHDAAGNASTGLRLDVAAVEDLFSRLTARAGGRPASQDSLPTDGHSAARLVLLRELMHHWPVQFVTVQA